MFSPIIIGGSEEKKSYWLELFLSSVIPTTLSILLQKGLEELSDYYKRKRDLENDPEPKLVQDDNGDLYCVINDIPYPVEDQTPPKKKVNHDSSKKRKLDSNKDK